MEKDDETNKGSVIDSPVPRVRESEGPIPLRDQVWEGGVKQVHPKLHQTHHHLGTPAAPGLPHPTLR